MHHPSTPDSPDYLCNFPLWSKFDVLTLHSIQLLSMTFSRFRMSHWYNHEALRCRYNFDIWFKFHVFLRWWWTKRKKTTTKIIKCTHNTYLYLVNKNSKTINWRLLIIIFILTFNTNIMRNCVFDIRRRSKNNWNFPANKCIKFD